MAHDQNNRFSISGRLHSFIHAFNGLGHTLRSEHNFRIHLFAGLVVVLCGVFVHLNSTEWCIVVLTIGLVLALEALNTAIEKLVDIVSPEYKKEAGLVKDIAAGAVLIAAIAAVITGIILFAPKLL
jgi:diacylglycerol kinase